MVGSLIGVHVSSFEPHRQDIFKVISLAHLFFSVLACFYPGEIECIFVDVGDVFSQYCIRASDVSFGVKSTDLFYNLLGLCYCHLAFHEGYTSKLCSTTFVLFYER